MNTFKTTVLLYVTVLTSPVFAAPHRAGEAVKTIAPTDSIRSPTSMAVLHDAVHGSHPIETVKASQVEGNLNKRMETPPDHLTIEILNAYGQYLMHPCLATSRSVVIQEANLGDRA